jgi:hypothetical protein
VKVIGAGLPRTATSTQTLVLEQLGFGPCYHMRNVFADLEGQLPPWERLVEGEADWDGILDGFESCCDFPSSRYYRELAEHYPDAKVLLSVRAPEGWVRSMRETIWPMYFGDSVLRHVNAARGRIDPNWGRFLALMIHMTWDGQTGALGPPEATFDDDAFAAAMNRWNERVKRDVPADRLLVWEPRQGWEPLCDFLEVPVPDDQVPLTNETAAFKEGIIGGALAVLNDWWDQRERPASGLHAAALD